MVSSRIFKTFGKKATKNNKKDELDENKSTGII